MTDWFRSWHGAPTDSKWLAIAKRANVAPGMVSAIVWALLDHASSAVDRGLVSTFDFETYAIFSGFDEQAVRAVYAALEAKGVIVDGKLSQWEKRQPRREDNSAERVKAHRTKAAPEPRLPLEEGSAQQEQESSSATTAAQNNSVSPEAIALADEIAVLAGHDLKFVPPAWCGAAMRVDMWLRNGWSRPAILDSVSAQMSRKRDGPPATINYFEKGIVRHLSEQSRPLPTVVPFPKETLVHRYAKPQSAITAAVDRVIADIEGGSGPRSESPVGLLSGG